MRLLFDFSYTSGHCHYEVYNDSTIQNTDFASDTHVSILLQSLLVY